MGDFNAVCPSDVPTASSPKPVLQGNISRSEKCTVLNAELLLGVLGQPAKPLTTMRDLLVHGTETAASFHLENRLRKIFIKDNKNFWLLLTWAASGQL